MDKDELLTEQDQPEPGTVVSAAEYLGTVAKAPPELELH